MKVFSQCFSIRKKLLTCCFSDRDRFFSKTNIGCYQVMLWRPATRRDSRLEVWFLKSSPLFIFRFYLKRNLFCGYRDQKKTSTLLNRCVFYDNTDCRNLNDVFYGFESENTYLFLVIDWLIWFSMLFQNVSWCIHGNIFSIYISQTTKRYD